jgi:hypothetical protein
MKRQDLLKITLIYLVILSLAMAVLYFFTHVLLGLPLWYVRIVIVIATIAIAAVVTGVWVLVYVRQRK